MLPLYEDGSFQIEPYSTNEQKCELRKNINLRCWLIIPVTIWVHILLLNAETKPIKWDAPAVDPIIVSNRA